MSKLTTAYELIHAAMRDDEFTSDELIKLDQAMALIENVENKAYRKLSNAINELEQCQSLCDGILHASVFNFAVSLEKLRGNLR